MFSAESGHGSPLEEVVVAVIVCMGHGDVSKKLNITFTAAGAFI